MALDPAIQRVLDDTTMPTLDDVLRDAADDVSAQIASLITRAAERASGDETERFRAAIRYISVFLATSSAASVSRLGTLGKHEFVDGRAVMLLSLATQLSIWLLDMFAKLATVDDERQEGYTKQFITLAMERFMDSSVPGVIDVFREAIEGDDNEGDDDVPNHTTGR